MKQKEDRFEKVFMSIFYIMYGIIVMGGTFYMAERMGDYKSLKELFFWSLLILTIGIRELVYIIKPLLELIQKSINKIRKR